MLKLTGHHAAIFFISKGGLAGCGSTFLEALQVGIAVRSGLSDPSWVRVSDVLQLVAETHDLVSADGLLKNPAQRLIDTMKLAYMGHQMHSKDGVPEASTVILEAMISNLTNMRIQTEHGVVLVDWKSGLDPDFENQAQKLYDDSLKLKSAAAVN